MKLYIKETRMFGLVQYCVVFEKTGQVLTSHMSREGAQNYIKRVINTLGVAT
jgi:hypothetical protein